MTNDYRTIAAPSSVKPLGSWFRWRSNLVDYAKHPAYATLVAEVGLIARVAALAKWTPKFALLLAKRIIRYEMIPGELRNGRALYRRLGFAKQAAVNATRIDKLSSAPEVVSPVRDQLNTQGVAVVVMPPERINELNVIASRHFAVLEAKRGAGANRREFGESRATADRDGSPELFALIERIFAESGMSAAVDAYIGRRARLIDVNPQINDPSDSFWRDIFEDIGERPLPPAAYCHRDASGGDIKVIIYCSEVDGCRGPFTYAVGSNAITISAVDNLLCEANDHNGLSATELESRRIFAALPAKLRQKGTFGNDLEPNHPQAQAIVDSLWEITAPAGSMVAFDTKGIHRGGMVIEGERRVLTCVLG